MQASRIPSMTWENCHITSGFSGLPKLRQSVRPTGRNTRTCSARTCGAPCGVVLSSNVRCTASTDTALCGALSGCELLNVSGGNCLLPYPSSVFEADDGSTATGKRIAYLRRGTPVNNMSVHIDPVPWNTLDGFSPGSMMMVAFPHGVDLAASNVPPLSNFGASLDPGSPVVLIDVDWSHYHNVEVALAVCLASRE